jgi:hypothetical protein
MTRFQVLPADRAADDVERALLARWEDEGLFRQTLRAREDAPPNNGAASASPYRVVVVNDLVVDAEGLKMSKSKGNVVDPWMVIGKNGVDAVRLFLVASSNVWVPRSFDEHVLAEQSRRFLRTFKNVYSGIFAQYANFGWGPRSRIRRFRTVRRSTGG